MLPSRQLIGCLVRQAFARIVYEGNELVLGFVCLAVILIAGDAEGTTRLCSGSARVLRGNPTLIGQSGAFSAPYAGTVYVTHGSAAIIPSQWASTRASLRPFVSQITGAFPLINAGFEGVSDIIGGAPPAGFRPNSNVQADLMMLYPGHLILELPGAPHDYGITTVVLRIPTTLSCPVGTTEIAP